MKIEHVIVPIFAVIMLYYIITVAYTAASPTASDSADLNATLGHEFANSPIVQVRSVSNATYSCTANNYSLTTTTLNLTADDDLCAAGTYTISYDYEAASTVFGIDFGWIAVIVLIGVGFLVVRQITKFK